VRLFRHALAILKILADELDGRELEVLIDPPPI